jgi:hypothetical protein
MSTDSEEFHDLETLWQPPHRISCLCNFGGSHQEILFSKLVDMNAYPDYKPAGLVCITYEIGSEMGKDPTKANIAKAMAVLQKECMDKGGAGVIGISINYIKPFSQQMLVVTGTMIEKKYAPSCS